MKERASEEGRRWKRRARQICGTVLGPRLGPPLPRPHAICYPLSGPQAQGILLLLI